MLNSSKIWLIIIHILFIFDLSYAQDSFNPDEWGWKQSTEMNPLFVNRTYLDIQFLDDDPNFGWACGFQGSFLRTTDGGDSWQTFEIFNVPEGQLESLQFLNKDVGYLTITSHPTTLSGATFKTVDGGLTWRTVLAPPAVFPNSISLWGHYFLNEDLGVVLGGECGGPQYFYKTTNGGINWTLFTVEAPEATKLSDPILFEDGSGYAVSSGYLWITSDFGSTWDISNNTREVTLFTLNNPQLILAANQDFTSYTTLNGDNVEIERVALNEIEVRTGNKKILIAGNYNGVLTTENNDQVYINGNLVNLYFSESIITSSSRFSRDWHEEITKIGNSIFIPYSNTCSGQNDSPAGFLFSSDLGNSWNTIYSRGPNYGTFLLDENRGWGCGFMETIVYTSDAGESWTEVNCGIPEGVNLDDIWFINDTTGWVAGDGIFKLTKIQKIKPEIQPKDTLFLCKGETLTLEVTEEFESYEWSNGRRTKQITINQPGEYYVAAYKNFICDLMYSDTISVIEIEAEQIEIFSNAATPVCEGDTVTLIASNGYASYLWSTNEETREIKITESGVYTVTAVDANGCETYASFEISFIPIPNAEILISGKLNICRGQFIELTAKPDNFRYTWVYQEAENSDTQIIFSQEQTVLPEETGFYNVIVSTENGCADISEMLFVEIREDSNRLAFRFNPDEIPVEIEDTNYPNLTCKNLIVTNLSNEAQELSSAFFLKNTEFSLPLSQLPIFVGPNSEAEIQVCYSPKRIGESRDTLVIGDNCSDHYIPMLAEGIGNYYTGDTRCDISIEMNTVDILQRYEFTGEFPFPNPADKQFIIEYKRVAEIDDNFIEKFYLINSLGEIILDGKSNVLNSSINNNFKLEFGNIIFNTENLNSGIYFVIIESKNKKENFPIVISK